MEEIKEYKVYVCIEDDEVKCSASVRICNTCEYKKVLGCQPGVIKPKPEEWELKDETNII